MDSFEMPDPYKPIVEPSYDDDLKAAATLLCQHLADEVCLLVKAGDVDSAVKASDVEAWQLFKDFHY